MVIKNSFKNYLGVEVSCYFCSAPTTYALQDERDGSEIWSCKSCLWKKGKIKRFQPQSNNSTLKSKKSKKSEFPRVKDQEMAKLGGIAE